MNLPPYNIFPTITSHQITLRKIVESDVKDILEIQFYDGKVATTLTEGIVILNKINQDYIDGNSIHWGIEDNTNNKIVGTLGYYRGFEKSTGELGCVLLPAFRGKGFMSNAMKLAISFGLNDIQLEHIIAITSVENMSAIKLLERIGFSKTTDLKNNELEFEFNRK